MQCKSLYKQHFIRYLTPSNNLYKRVEQDTIFTRN